MRRQYTIWRIRKVKSHKGVQDNVALRQWRSLLGWSYRTALGSLQTMDRLAIRYVRQPNGPNKQEAVKGFLAQNKCGIIGILETKTSLRRRG